MPRNPHLELVQRVTAAPGYTRHVGTRVLAAEAGCVELALDRKPELLQGQGVFHGGVIAALADHAAGGAVTTAMPNGRFAVTVNLQVSYLAPGKGETLIARAKAVQVGNTIGVAHVDIHSFENGVETLCAFAVVTLRGVDMPQFHASSRHVAPSEVPSSE
jgi:uncharacterized protein (TIGR00369 family)